MKKKFLFVSAILICLGTLSYGTHAYFTASDKAHNVITSGGIDIQIEEWQEIDQGLVPYPKDEPAHIMPGTELSKIVTVKNLEAPSYIRAGLDVVITDSDGKIMELTAEELDQILHIVINKDNWVQKEASDGWWYYKESVDTGAVTEPLFTEVLFDGPNMTNEYQNCTVEVIVNAQAVQSANNPIPDGENVTDILGWPEN